MSNVYGSENEAEFRRLRTLTTRLLQALANGEYARAKAISLQRGDHLAKLHDSDELICSVA